MKKKIKVKNISCSNCAKTITNAIKNLNDEIEVDVNISTSVVYVKYDETKVEYEAILNTLKKAGYPSEESGSTSKKNEIELKVAIVLCIPLVLSMFSSVGILDSYIPKIFLNGYVQISIASIIQFYIGRNFYKHAYLSLKQKVLGMDALVVLGSTTAYLYSAYILLYTTVSYGEMKVMYFEVSSLVITIVLIGKTLEHRVKEKTSESVNQLLDLSVKQARLMMENEEVMVEVKTLKIGDRVVVLPNEAIPIDSTIIEGRSLVDESSFTGESIPVSKHNGDSVIGGTINVSGKLICEVEKIGDETVLNQIIGAVEEASLVKVKYQRIADKIASIFVPIIILIAIFTYFMNIWLGNDVTTSFINSISVILISCPCALGLATPTSIMTANGIAAKRGILYKGGAFFEIGGKIEVICFDKTGTITKGKPGVKKFDIDQQYFDMIYSIEKMSNHPISKAVISYLEGRNLSTFDVENYEVVVGQGIKAICDGKKVMIGNMKLMKENGIDISPVLTSYTEQINNNYTVNLVGIDGKIVGIYSVFDEIKDTAITAIKELHKLNIKTVMITGDNDKVAKNIAKKVGIDETYSSILPVQKADIVKKYKDQNLITAFVGDGINDAVALSSADVGISIFEGADVAINASDVTLMKDDLNLILDGIKISNETSKNIYQNLFWAFSYNIVAIPLASLGFLNMVVAAVAMGFSSIVVVLNALRLKNIKFEDR